MKKKKYTIPKRTERGKIKAEAKKELLKKDREFYMTVWNKRPHLCNFCKCSLGYEPRTYHFDHILEKEVYPEYRHEPKNIQLLCLDCHNSKTSGHTPIWFKDFVTNLKDTLCQDTHSEIQLQEDTEKTL